MLRGSSDSIRIARLRAEDIDWESRVVSFFRSKTGSAQIVHFGPGLAEVLQELPRSGGSNI
jgi:hypothetical protein